MAYTPAFLNTAGKVLHLRFVRLTEPYKWLNGDYGGRAIVIANVGKDLHIRIFDASGK